MIVTASVSLLTFAAKNKGLTQTPIQKVQSGIQRVSSKNTVVDAAELAKYASKINPRLSYDELAKIDRMLMRQIFICPLLIDKDRYLSYGGPTKSYGSWITNEQMIGVSVNPTEKAIMDKWVSDNGYTLMGYYTEVQFEIAGASTVSLRKIVARQPADWGTVTSIKNGLYNTHFMTGLVDTPSVAASFRGQFEYYMQFDIPGMQNTGFSAFSSFTAK